MLVFLKIKIAQSFGGAARDAFGRSELGHEQTAATEAANDAAKEGVGDTGHGRQDGGGGDGQVANFEGCGKH